MEPESDQFGAFVPGPRFMLESEIVGPLNGLRLAVKDLFDLAGVPTTFGNPDWARTHPVPDTTARLVVALLAAGVHIIGKTRTVELAYGLTGENIWHGTPINPRCPDRFPGGSSCGSAAAVAGGLADLALGSDTGGSVRIPASYCGLFGIRPTQGAIDMTGAAPLAPSLDTPGWFARSADVLALAGDALLPPDPAPLRGPLLRVDEAWVNAAPDVARALAPVMERLRPLLGPALAVQLVPEGLPALHLAYLAVQGREAWATLGPWVTAHNPALSPAVAGRLQVARQVTAEQAAAGEATRSMLRDRLHRLLAGGAVLVFPTSPCPAPRLSATERELQDVREATLGVTSIAGLAGLPEVTLPVADVAVPEGRAPIGLSLVAGPGRDRALLALARDVARLLAASQESAT
jgi:amidase